MLLNKDFWELEKECSLLKENHNYLSETKDISLLLKQSEELYEFVIQKGIQSNLTIPTYDPEKQLTVTNEGIARIIDLDVFRTLKSKKYQSKMIHLLSQLYLDFGDYAQPMCLVASFLHLTLKIEQVYQMIHVINKSPFYIPDYWKAQAIGYAIDSYSTMYVCSEVNPQTTQHVLKIQPFPESFCQKYFTAIGIHCFPFELEFKVMNNFLKYGRKYLVQLVCSIFDKLSNEILQCKDAVQLFGYLRLEPNVVTVEKMKEIVDSALNYNQVEKYDIHAVRERMYEVHLKARLERKNDDDDDEIILSDDSDEDN